MPLARDQPFLSAYGRLKKEVPSVIGRGGLVSDGRALDASAL